MTMFAKLATMAVATLIVTTTLVQANSRHSQFTI